MTQPPAPHPESPSASAAKSTPTPADQLATQAAPPAASTSAPTTASAATTTESPHPASASASASVPASTDASAATTAETPFSPTSPNAPPNPQAANDWHGPQDALQQTVSGIFEVVSGRLPDERAADFIHPDVQVAIGSLVAKGISYWYAWLHLGRKTCGLENLGLEAVAMTTQDQSVLIHARFTGQNPDGTHEKSTPVTFRHRFADGRVFRMETLWPNYGFMFGKLSTVILLRPVLIFRLWTHHRRWKKSARQRHPSR